MLRPLALMIAIAAMATLLTSAAWCTDGVVVDIDGKPVAGAKVYVFKANEKIPAIKPLFADSEGKFTCPTPEKGRWCYFAAADGFAYGAVYKKAADAAKVKVMLWPEKKISGQVVDEKGKPVPGATIRLKSFWAWNRTEDKTRPLPQFSLSDSITFAGVATTGKDGRFVLLHVPDPSTFESFSLSLDEFAPGRALISRSWDTQEIGGEIKIIDPPACSVSGTIYLPGKSGPAPEGLEIEVQFLTPGYCAQIRSTALDKSGKFVFRDLPPGPADLMLSFQARHYNADGKEVPAAGIRDWALPAAKAELTPKRPTNVELVLVPGALIKGKVVDKDTGKPPTRGSITVNHAGRPDETEPDRVDLNDKGEFALRVAPGDVKVTLSYCEIDKKYRSYSEYGPEDAPSVQLALADGQEKTDIVLNSTPEENSSESYEAARKPAPPDFELKPGVYQLTWDAEVDATGQSWSSGDLSGDKAKAKMRKLPKLKSKKPTYIAAQLDSMGDDGLLFAIFDQSWGTGSGYDTAYVDLNRNGDLTDDKPVRWRARERYSDTPWMTAQAHQGAGADRANNPVTFRWQMSDVGPRWMTRRGGWKGTLDSTKGPIQVILFDWNRNGLYNDRFSCGDESMFCWQEYDWGDCAFADVNGYGKAVSSSQWRPHCLTQGGVNVFGEKGFVLTASAAGNTITVAPYEGQTGKLLVRGVDINGMDGPVTFLNFIGKHRIFTYSKLEGQAVTLPVGRYLLGFCSIELQKDKDKLSVGGSIDKLVEIKSGEQTTITISGKPTLRILPDKREVVFKPKADGGVAWDIVLGDALKDVYLNNSPSTVPKVKFDEQTGFLGLKPFGGG